MGFKMKGPSMHKGTKKHTGALKDKYYEELKNDQYGCHHKTVLMEKLDGESILVCERCGEDVTGEVIG